MNRATHNPALRRLHSIPSRPSHDNAAVGHAGIAWLRRRSLVAALRAASNLFPPSPFQIGVKRTAAEDGAEFPSPSHMRPGLGQADAKGKEHVDDVSGQTAHVVNAKSGPMRII
jgi:hypothetical protein